MNLIKGSVQNSNKVTKYNDRYLKKDKAYNRQNIEKNKMSMLYLIAKYIIMMAVWSSG